jgi:hypothetical protein
MGDDINWLDVWAATASQLDEYRGAGLEALLTEDVLRFATIQQLAAAGVAPNRLEVEWRRSGVPDAVDLVVSGAGLSAVEFKFPREPREKNAAWTQHLGEALKDLYRLAHMPREFADRWCVQLLSTRMLSYLDGVADRHGVRFGLTPGSTTVLEPSRVRALPGTAHKGLGRWLDDLPVVRARCVASHRIGDQLQLVLHTVDAVG